MPRKLADKLQASAWGKSMPTLEYLGLFDKETVQNITRSFRDEVRLRDCMCHTQLHPTRLR